MCVHIGYHLLTLGVISLVNLLACLYLGYIHIDGIHGIGQVEIAGTVVQLSALLAQLHAHFAVGQSVVDHVVIIVLHDLHRLCERSLIIYTIVLVTQFGHHSTALIEVGYFVVTHTLVPYRLLELLAVQHPCQLSGGHDIQLEGVVHYVLLLIYPPVVLAFTVLFAHEVLAWIHRRRAVLVYLLLLFIDLRDGPAVGELAVGTHPARYYAALLITSHGRSHAAVIHMDSA